MMTTRATQTVTLNCGHRFTYTAGEGQLSIPTWLAPDHPYTCIHCWNLHGYEGVRYVVHVTDIEPEPAQAPKPRRCLRPGCGRTLTSAQSIARGYGPTCWAKVRKAARDVALAQFAHVPHLVAKAEELIEAGGIVPLRSGRVFRTAGSRGARYLTAPEACNCAAGLRGKHVCHHRIAAAAVRATYDLRPATAPTAYALAA
ncbi:DUF6011 domain-containing protein [Actinoallomurus sp. CA-142502]|uniref:DUF6011 domain-containing protein n=1 Tax=Actinoallomurus sp. CA-142502 TaxID=3239885 RepID=UPI003D8A4AFD